MTSTTPKLISQRRRGPRAQSQAFFDGNKRTGLAAATAFLELNDVASDADQSVIVEAMIAIAERRLDKPGLAALFRDLFSGK